MEMMAGVVLSTLLPKLDGLLTGEYNLQKNIRGEVMFLRAELESMQAALERVSSSSSSSPVRIWASEVRELSYEIEDSVDKIMVRVDVDNQHNPGLGGFIGRSLSLLTTARVRHRIATDIKVIRGRVKEVSERRDRYKVDDHAATVRRPVIDPRLHGIYEESRRLVAIGGPRLEIERMMMEEEGRVTERHGLLKVVAILGVGGLGKTTLANAVYQQSKGRFDCGAFVTVSTNPDLKRVLGSLLRQVSKQSSYSDIETWDAVEIIDKIRQVLRDKR